jgi:hypothetical protein
MDQHLTSTRDHGYSPRQDGILAALLDAKWPGNLKRNVRVVFIDHKHLIAALWRIQALVVSCALEEVRDVIGANPVTTARRRNQNLALVLCTSANYAALLRGSHFDIRSRVKVVSHKLGLG